MRIALVLPALLVALPAPIAAAAGAAETGKISGTITVHKKDGTVKADASDIAIYVSDLKRPDGSARATIRQHDRQFVPRVTVVPAGAKINFVNDDTEEHNVFSHSAAADFDLGRAPKGSNKSHAFPDPGESEIFCNVHKEMVCYLVVAPSPAFALTGSDGRFEIGGVPAGHHKVVVWERFARPRSQEVEVDVKAGESTPLTLDVVEKSDSDPEHKNKQGINYQAGYH